MVATTRIEWGVAMRTAFVGVEISPDGQLVSARAAEHGRLIEFRARPTLRRVIGGLVVAPMTGEILPAALELDRDDVEGAVVVGAAGLAIDWRSRQARIAQAVVSAIFRCSIGNN